MRRKKFVLAAAVALTLIAGPSTFALLRETDINYYYDDSFATWVGEYDVDCDGNVADSGTVGFYRVYDQYSCSTGQRVVHRCQQADGMGGWITITCPLNQP